MAGETRGYIPPEAKNTEEQSNLLQKLGRYKGKLLGALAGIGLAIAPGEAKADMDYIPPDQIENIKNAESQDEIHDMMVKAQYANDLESAAKKQSEELEKALADDLKKGVQGKPKKGLPRDKKFAEEEKADRAASEKRIKEIKKKLQQETKTPEDVLRELKEQGNEPPPKVHQPEIKDF